MASDRRGKALSCPEGKDAAHPSWHRCPGCAPKAKESLSGRVGQQEPFVRVGHDDRIAHVAQNRRQQFALAGQRFLGLLLLRDVAHHGEDGRLAAQHHRRRVDVHRNDLAVLGAMAAPRSESRRRAAVASRRSLKPAAKPGSSMLRVLSSSISAACNPSGGRQPDWLPGYCPPGRARIPRRRWPRTTCASSPGYARVRTRPRWP